MHKNTSTKLAGGFIALSAVLACSSAVEEKSENKKPNIIVLMVDDACYADFGFKGSKDLKTPNIDKLAAGGVIFTDAHVSATVCGPSRAGIMTGRYQQRFGFECNPSSDTCGVDLNEITIASALKKEGYSTAAFGKWHLGSKPGYRPNERGFDYYWGFLSGSRSYFPNPVTDREGKSQAITENFTHVALDGYLTDRQRNHCPFVDGGAQWDTITRMIHQDLMLNRPVRANDPGQFKKNNCN